MGKRAILSGTGIATACVSGFCLYQLSGSKEEPEEVKDLTTSISSLFQRSPNKVLLTPSSSEEDWNRAWSNYKNAHQDTSSDEWKIPNFENQKSTYNVLPAFKDACTGRYSMRAESEEDITYQRISQWCTRAKKVSELLKDEEGIELIPENGDDRYWTTSWIKYRDFHKSSSNAKDTWEIDSWEADSKSDNLSDSFKTKCLLQAKQDIVNGKEDQLYQQVKNWCTKSKNI
ncbi:hypothetical protein HF1_08050 [Mycoplasma haemofelis str. Langford 1]|uniref:Lipoprotein n=1 Tax=Mycoplasma haemofelis (strain Langford 1) TaxID=941640 RepID=E8ZI42_MYCHL|nr:hypothetical protein [Mycoplasma haemofelis]CBY92813.1 hypothetical protein HF1_08050 [Mycoplasma haemofelis str. Langford 1]